MLHGLRVVRRKIILLINKREDLHTTKFILLTSTPNADKNT